MVTFNWPWMLLLLPLPWLWRYLARRISGLPMEKAIKIPPRVQLALDDIESEKHSPDRLQQWLLWLAWILLIIAAAQPQMRSDTTAQSASGRSLAVVVDLSASMERKDFRLAGEAVDRLSVVKHVAAEFIRHRRGDRIALVLYGSDAFLASPPSYDLAAIINELNSSGIGMAGRTTAIGDALGLAIGSLRDDPAPQKAIVLLSDGTNNAGTAEPESAAELARQLSIRIHTIGMASDSDESESNNQWYAAAAADLDEDTLQRIANASGGEFFRARSSDELTDVYDAINTLEGGDSQAPPVVVNSDVRNVLLVLLLGVLLLHSAISLRKGSIA